MGRPEPSANSEGISKRAARKQAKKDRIEAAKKKAGAAGFSNAEKGAQISNNSKKALSDAANGTNGADDTSVVTPPTVTDDLSGIDFGQVIGLKKKSEHGNNKSLANQGKKKSLESMLAEAEAKKKRLRELKGSENEGDREKASRIEWGDALKAATGERVRDDPAMIKKAMKRKEKKKAKSAKMWEARIETVADSMTEKQKIRKHNLEKRKLGGEEGMHLSSKRIKDEEEEKKRKRLGPHAMKGRDDKHDKGGDGDGKAKAGGGRNGAGFEGKKDGFINGKKKGAE
jgi:hypothetical protein